MNEERGRALATEHMGKVIQRLAGPDAKPRGDQLDSVEAIIKENARVLVVKATGWGKSAVYWAATSALRANGLGPTLFAQYDKPATTTESHVLAKDLGYRI